ncbi:unnamed protein product [Rhizopus stolonifer]
MITWAQTLKLQKYCHSMLDMPSTSVSELPKSFDKALDRGLSSDIPDFLGYVRLVSFLFHCQLAIMCLPSLGYLLSSPDSFRSDCPTESKELYSFYLSDGTHVLPKFNLSSKVDSYMQKERGILLAKKSLIGWFMCRTSVFLCG